MNKEQPSGSPELQPGEQFNRYTIVKRLGRGGMATVYEAIHGDLQKRVALKTMLPWFALRTDLVQRFMIEARAASRLAHLHVVAVHDIGVEKDIPFMAMDLLEGEDLCSMIERAGPLPAQRVAGIFLPIASALAAAHRAGILHRDIKPENIFIARRAPFGEHPMLLDFGLAKVDVESPVKALTSSSELLGTPHFMAPEQVVGGMDRYTARSDQYAIGVVMYECLTGILPFPGEDTTSLLEAIARGGAPPPSAHRASIPAGLENVVLRAMAHRPEDRFSSMRALGRAILPFAAMMTRAVWSAEFEEQSASRNTIEVVPFRVSDLRAVRSLQGASDQDLGRAAALGEITRLMGGVTLCVQGTPGSSCFVLLSGEVEITRTCGYFTREIATISAGSVIGLAALWDDGPRPVSATTTKESVVLEISREALSQMETLAPSVADSLLDEAIRQAIVRVGSASKHAAPSARSSAVELDRDALIGLAASLREWSFPSPP